MAKIEVSCGCGKLFLRSSEFLAELAAKQQKPVCPHCQRKQTSRKKISCVCPECAEIFTRSLDYIQSREARGKAITCTQCSNSQASKAKWQGYSDETKEHIRTQSREGVVLFNSKLTTQEKFDRSQKAGAANKGGKSVIRQWETVKSDPVLWEAAKKRLQKTAQTFWDSLTPEEKNIQIRKSLFKNANTGRSGAGDRFVDRLVQEGFDLKVEQDIQGFIVDALIKTDNLIIEFYGDIFHCNPSKFQDPEFYCSWLNRTVAQQWARDRKRLGVFYRFGYRVVVVWESNWNSNKEHEIERIHNALREIRSSSVK